MATTTDRVTELFEDAQVLYGDALEMLAMGKLRNAAEKAWGATKRSTDAMVLARTGHELLLHINCFYDGNCEPEPEMTALILATESYIQDARNLAAAQ